jgi:3-deoxy-alpha-D-manno-octulosonate 8-oxidase
VAVPTLAGTGAEASRTAVLTGPVRKLGINSVHSMYDGVLMDPELIRTAEAAQAFFTGMDGFIHAVEALGGSAINALGRPFAEKSKEAFQRHFSGEPDEEALMVGSYLGGASIANSSVGVCHALSYGLSFYLGFRHGMANAIVFNRLEAFYGSDVETFHAMVERNGIRIPAGVTRSASEETLGQMADMAYLLERDLVSALGTDYRRILPKERILDLYARM